MCCAQQCSFPLSFFTLYIPPLVPRLGRRFILIAVTGHINQSVYSGTTGASSWLIMSTRAYTVDLSSIQDQHSTLVHTQLTNPSLRLGLYSGTFSNVHIKLFCISAVIYFNRVVIFYILFILHKLNFFQVLKY